ncbi:MAG TPA: TetR family transcriptional regulator [Dongiaceae bacterium]|nr:TetR family transcriptional regulator [Dongiaceae bacterium]
MKTSRTSRISVRKQPKQQRSSQLVADILEAAIRVLQREGAQRFTTARVAETAGVSIGSLYQYFPNKGAILFRLQADEWQRTGGMLQSILAERTRSPQERLRAVVTAFFRSECEEADLRGALNDAAPLIRDAPESRELLAAGMRRVSLFMRETIPGLSKAERGRAADIIMMSLSSVGKQVSEQGLSPAEVDRLASAMGDMFCAYLDQLIAKSKAAGKSKGRRVAALATQKKARQPRMAPSSSRS